MTPAGVVLRQRFDGTSAVSRTAKDVHCSGFAARREDDVMAIRCSYRFDSGRRSERRPRHRFLRNIPSPHVLVVIIEHGCETAAIRGETDSLVSCRLRSHWLLTAGTIDQDWNELGAAGIARPVDDRTGAGYGELSVPARVGSRYAFQHGHRSTRHRKSIPIDCDRKERPVPRVDEVPCGQTSRVTTVFDEHNPRAAVHCLDDDLAFDVACIL